MRVKDCMTRNSDEDNSSGFFIVFVSKSFCVFDCIVISSKHETGLKNYDKIKKQNTWISTTLSQNVCKNEKRGMHHESENRKQISERSRVNQAYCTGQKMFWLISPQNYGSLFCISLTESKHMGEDEFLFSFNENEGEIKTDRLDLRKNLLKNISMKYIRITPEKRRMNTRKSFRSRKV